MSDDLKPEDMVVVIRRCVAEVVDIFAQHAPDAPPVDLRLRRELSGAIERATDEAFITGVLSPERISADVAEIINRLDDICPDDLDNDQLRDVWAACTNFTVWAGTEARRRRLNLHAMGQPS